MEITGKILKIRYYNEDNNFGIVQIQILKKERDFAVNKKEILKGYFPICKEGDIIVAKVLRDEQKIYGKTLFAPKPIKIELPSEANDLKEFFLEIDGVGPKDANKIIQKLGVTAIEKINKNSLVLARIGVTPKNRESIVNKCKLYFEMTELSTFATALNIRISKILVLYRLWGTSTANNINHNIYNAIYETDEFTMYEADLITIAKGKSKVSKERVSGAIVAYLRFQEKQFGNIYTTDKKIYKNLIKFLNNFGAIEKEFNVTIQKKFIISCLNDLETKGTIKVFHKGNRKSYTRTAIYNTEKLVAKNIVEFIEENEFPFGVLGGVKEELKTEDSLDKTQKKAILNAVKYPISIITGGPGTGKSHTASMLIDLLESNNIESMITATTGKAATKLYENTGKSSYTIHSRLQALSNFKGKNLLIIDEFSMADLFLMNDIFKVMKKNLDYHIVLVGDVDQLPSVGVGDMLKSLIDSDLIPVTYLEKIYRQGEGSEIIQLSKDIKDSKKIDLVNYNDEEIIPISCRTEDVKKQVFKIYKTLKKKYSLDEIAVLTPINGHEVGVQSMNDYLAPKLNLNRRKYPDEFVVSNDSEYFYEGDRVMQTKNSKDLSIANGEVGEIIEIDYEEDSATVEYKDGSENYKTISYNKEALNHIQLANAMSVHKSQGSEYKAVIIISDELAKGLMTKKLIYTGVTRAKELLYVVGDIALFQERAKKKTKDRNELLNKLIISYHIKYCKEHNIEY